MGRNQTNWKNIGTNIQIRHKKAVNPSWNLKDKTNNCTKKPPVQLRNIQISNNRSPLRLPLPGTLDTHFSIRLMHIHPGGVSQILPSHSCWPTREKSRSRKSPELGVAHQSPSLWRHWGPQRRELLRDGWTVYLEPFRRQRQSVSSMAGAEDAWPAHGRAASLLMLIFQRDGETGGAADVLPA